MMNILIVVPRYSLENKINYNYILPIGLGYIYSSLVKAGYEPDCLNLNHFEGHTEKIINNMLDSKKFDLVCTGNNALGYAITEIIVQTVKGHSSRPLTVLGGPVINSEPELILDALRPSFGVLGEGEETIVDLVKTVEKKGDLSKVKGIIYKDSSGKMVKTIPRDPISDLDSIAFPNYDKMGVEKQLNNISTNFIFFSNLSDNTRMYPFLASRSCPYQCTFCYHDSKYRKRSIENIMEEISLVVKKYKINMLTIHDECFSIDEERLKEFCKRISDFRKEISWDLKWSCQLRVEAASKEVLRMMKDAGCSMIGYGLESYSPAVLKSMRKYVSPQRMDKALKDLFEVGIALQGFFIFGDVAETKETAKETLGYWKKECNGQVGLGFIQPYPGSEIYKKCVEKGIIKDKLKFIKNLTVNEWFNMTDSMTDDEIRELRREILYLTGKYTKFTKPLKVKRASNNHYDFLIECPFCKERMNYRNCQIPSRFSYGFNLICRNCLLRFFVVNEIQRIAYANYSRVRALRDFQLRIKRSIKKKAL